MMHDANFCTIYYTLQHWMLLLQKENGYHYWWELVVVQQACAVHVASTLIQTRPNRRS